MKVIPKAQAVALIATDSHEDHEILPDAVQFDLGNRQITIGGRTIRLSKTEALLLSLLIAGAGVPITREHLLTSVWNCHTTCASSKIWMETRLVDGQIAGLRRKLRPHHTLIVTVRGFGYAFQINSTCSLELPL